MGETRAVRLLIFGSHVIGDVHGHDRGAVIPVEDNVKSVIQVKLLEFNFIQLPVYRGAKSPQQNEQKSPDF